MSEDQGEKELKSLCKLFIGGIPRDITDDQLGEYFLQFTEDEVLNDCVVIKDETKSSRGFGFVTYNRLSDTDNCLANRPHNFGGKDVEVKHAIPRDEKIETNHIRTNKIFIGGLSKEATEEEVTNVIENHVLAIGEGLNVKITNVNIMKDQTGVPRGFAFLDMASEDDADKVVIVKHFMIGGSRAELKKAEPKGGAPGGRGGGGRGRGGRGGMRGGGSRNTNQFGGGGGGMGGWGGGGGNQFAGYGDASAYGGYTSFGVGMDMYNQYAQQASQYGPSRQGNGQQYYGAGRSGPY